jgi:hypothetical protein
MAFNDEGGDGVAGWLAFFTVALGLFTPLAVLISGYSNMYGNPAVAQAYGEAWGALQIFEWAVIALVIGGCWYIVWRLFKIQTWTTVRITIAGIWILAVGSIFGEGLGVSLIAGLPLAAIFDGVLADLVRPLVFCSVWTAYFMISKRVANTYPRAGQEVAEVFG